MQKHDATKPNIVARMQGHATAFSICLQNNDLAGAMLNIQILNKDLPKDNQIAVGHGIDKSTIGDISHPNIENAKLIDDVCEICKSSKNLVDIHVPPEIINAQDKLHSYENSMTWISDMAILVEGRISEVGYKKGWFRE